MKGKGSALQEHLASIAAKGGQARAKGLSAAKKKAIAQKGGQTGGKARGWQSTRVAKHAGGKARAKKLSVARRRENARKAGLAGGQGRKE